MARNEEKNVPEATAANTALYKVGYTYIAKDGNIRTGAMVIETTSAEKAKAAATEKLAASALNHPRIGKVTVY